MKYKINKKYTNDFEKLSINFIVYLYKTSDEVELKNEIILFLLNKYETYFSYKVSKFLNKEDLTTFLYTLLYKSLNNFKLNTNSSFKTYILNNQDYLIRSFVTNKRLNKENEENGKIITIHNFGDYEGSSYIENISDDINTEEQLFSNITIKDIEKDLSKMGVKWKMFYDRTFKWFKLKELSKKYWYHLERCRQIVEEIRKIIILKYK